jgi:hypothetical protein
VDYLTFSFIPSVFLLLSTMEEQTQFICFLSSILNENFEFGKLLARAAFVIPEFQQFLGEIESHMFVRYSEIDSRESFRAVFTTFLEQAAIFKTRIPRVVSQLAAVPRAEEIFRDSFFVPLFASPQRFGLTVPGEGQIEQIGSFWDGEFGLIEAFCRIARDSSDDISGGVFEEVFRRMPVYGHSFILTTADMRLLEFLKQNGTDRGIVFEVPESEWSLIRLREASACVWRGTGQSLLNKMLLSAERIPNDTAEDPIDLVFLYDNLVEPLPSYEAQRGRMRLELLRREFPDGVPMPLLVEVDAKLKDPREGFARPARALAIEERFLANHVVTQKSIGQGSLLSFCLCERGFHIDVISDVSMLLDEITTTWSGFSKTAEWKWCLSYRVAVITLWEEIPYERFMGLDESFTEMDRAFSSVLNGREMREGQESRAVAAVADDFEEKGKEIIEWTRTLYRCSQLSAVAHALEKIHEVSEQALLGEGCRECAPDDFLLLSLMAMQSVKPVNWVSRLLWMLAIGCRIVDRTGDCLLASTFPQEIMPMRYLVQVSINKDPRLKQYTQKYPELVTL